MTHTRIVGLCLVAAFAFSATLAASAHAETHINSGSVFTDSIGGGAVFSTSQTHVECKASIDEGVLTSPLGDEEIITFEECETLGKKCGNVAPGTIVTKLLATELGWIRKAKSEVGVDFKPQAGTFLMEFECPGSPSVTFKIKGSVIGRVTSTLNEMQLNTNEVFSGSGFAQEAQSFEGGPKDTLITETNATGTSQLETLLQTTVTTENDPQETLSPPADPDFYPDPSEIGTVQSGIPEYGRCRKPPGPSKWKYKDANCTQKEPPVDGDDGKYEWFPIPA